MSDGKCHGGKERKCGVGGELYFSTEWSRKASWKYGDLGARPEEERERATQYLGSVLAERAACVEALR